MFISVYMSFEGRVPESKWADEILASCEMLRNVVQCQPSLAAPKSEGGSVSCFFFFIVFAAIDNRLCTV